MAFVSPSSGGGLRRLRLLPVLLVAAMTLVACACGHHGAGPRDHGPPPQGASGERPRGPDIDAVLDRLDLTDQQAQQVRALFEAQGPARDARQAAGGLPPSREDMEASRKQFHEQLAAILTPEQLAKFDELMHRERPPHPPGPEPRGQR